MARPGELPNLLLVTVDCLRRDRISAYGYERKTTPFLDSLLDDALHCTSAHSAAPWTAPSVVSMLTGLYPHSHGAGLIRGEPKNLSRESLPTGLRAEIPTLAEMLPGYATAAFLAVWSAALPLKGRFGTMEKPSSKEKPASKLIRAVRRWIGEQDGPFFCWVHLGDTHDPLDVPRSLRDSFGSFDFKSARRWAFTHAGDDLAGRDFDRYRGSRVLCYDSAVRGADRAIEGLWSGLGHRRARTILVVTSDHGEEMWEHRDDEAELFVDPRGVAGVGHGHNLFQVHLLVPLILAGPGVPRGAIDANVSSVDIVPTILEAVGMDGRTTDGVSLLGEARERPILAEGIAYGHEKRTVILGDEKLLVSPGDNFERAYRLGADRIESGVVDDLAVIEGLRAHLPETAAMDGERIAIDKEMADHLRDLGYLE